MRKEGEKEVKGGKGRNPQRIGRSDLTEQSSRQQGRMAPVFISNQSLSFLTGSPFETDTTSFLASPFLERKVRHDAHRRKPTQRGKKLLETCTNPVLQEAYQRLLRDGLPPSLSPSFLPVAARRDGGKDDRGGREGGREGGKEGGKEGGREGGEEGGQSRQQLLSGREAEVCEAEEGGREGGREGGGDGSQQP
ncbi:hypothetical protein NSK_005703 [Nannochloropsis salina CCMP1776]|uniref:Uncharacterized protein n=1 Tax=Nannochloropsis salina CCMP1776 TaxID=1027361 RepID=A0A4D9CVN0_9STRA|nr:hypothetical protein NSK_005703 [Nannochloropsis salina CCMP1776]|eukprot:TFJ82986.1 hypothetical protein NSK_005703 [Nannochloropsis salina CCMP1776]